MKTTTDEEDFFYKILLSFEYEIDLIWNDLSQETLIAACLDPRFA
jgi:hypothetical protein